MSAAVCWRYSLHKSVDLYRSRIKCRIWLVVHAHHELLHLLERLFYKSLNSILLVLVLKIWTSRLKSLTIWILIDLSADPGLKSHLISRPYSEWTEPTIRAFCLIGLEWKHCICQWLAICHPTCHDIRADLLYLSNHISIYKTSNHAYQKDWAIIRKPNLIWYKYNPFFLSIIYCHFY
jgi:hypothetical protein